MSYIIPFYDFTLPDIPYDCLILTQCMYDTQHFPVVPLCLLVSGTKYSHTLLLNINLFGLFNIIFD